MGKKSKRTTKHDRMVGNVARGFKSQGWDVQADVPSYPTPRTIDNKKPDIRAKKGAKERVVEVERPSTLKKDAPQRKVFKKWASQSKKRRFRTKITK